ncbi:hypothetical protein FOZ63_006725 [Perkinsus olseni]|uniref:Uncharacterized protein n=1 Tax=Perkinsus olseni TaxID=32597 RepID=A0A7J6SHC3_PEROL|nr:hypothetical protein FOZ63_006725 [Perkinsus olseni]KAF4731952.1 hypothetical protein FOZ62_006117 [Perkinsus olseni]
MGSLWLYWKRQASEYIRVAVDGRYRDRGRGDLTIGLHSAGSELSRALRFRRGVRSVSTGLDVSDLINACKEPDSLPAAAISYLNRLRGFRGDLLAVCSEPLIDSPIPRVNPTADIYSGGVYNDRDGIRRFFVEVISSFRRPSPSPELSKSFTPQTWNGASLQWSLSITRKIRIDVL